jgi:uncharacterized DUF497 family protein
VQFEWDPNKNRANLAKHGIDFATAALVFGDPQMKLREDRIDEMGERRWHALGRAGGLEPVLIIVHVYRESDDGEEIIRIISARKARTRERRAYLP